MASTSYSYPLGTYAGRTVRLTVDITPADAGTPGEVGSYAVVLYVVRPTGEGDGERVQIARIDDRRHGGPHLDRLFSDEGGREFFDEGFGLDEAEQHMWDNWERYARQYSNSIGF